MALSEICTLCEQIFESWWVEKEAWDVARNTTSHSRIGGKEGVSEVSGSMTDTNSSSSELWFERPGWVKVVEGKSETSDLSALDASSLFSPKHHNIVDLEQSAYNGCSLCTTVADLVHDKLEELDHPTEDFISRLSSIAIVRPSQAACDIEGSLILQISYFVDGKVEENSFVFSAEILLLVDQSLPRSLTDLSGANVRTRFDKIRNWISECSKNHQDCQERLQQNPEAPKRLPTRLLFVEPAIGHPKVTLVETKDLDTKTRYATLSHCWGQSPIIRLLTDLYVQFVDGIDFGSLSKTFQDAVVFTSALNLQYLWIDSLCIIQDSKEDWIGEASLMCSVYSNSWVTFAATSSRDGSGGLFPPENTLLRQPCVVEASWLGHQPGKYLCIDQSAWKRHVQNGALNKRGWVLQERILAPRTIHCANDQLWWSCADTDTCCNETFPDGVPEQSQQTGMVDPITDFRLLAKHDMIACNELWLAIVRDYTQRELTYGSDKLIALSGIAEAAMKFMGFSKDFYLAGLWKDDLMVDLLWRMAGTGTRPATYRAPSWSWASVDGDVYFHASEVRRTARENMCSILLEAQVTPVHDPLGLVQSGYIIIQGPLLRLKLSNPETISLDNFWLEKLHIGDMVYEAGSGFEESLDHNSLYIDWPEDGREFHFGFFTSTIKSQTSDEYMLEGLILERTGDTQGEYSRIGWFRIFHSLPNTSFFANVAGMHSLTVDDYLGMDGGYTCLYKVV